MSALADFYEFFARLWMSQLPRKLAYAICVAIVFELLVWFINSRIRRCLRPALQRDREADPQLRASRMRLLLRPPMLCARMVLYTIALAIILRIFGFSLRWEVFPILAAVAAAAVVAAWPIMHDAVRGYMLAYQNAYNVGDEVTIGEVRGRVVAFGLACTKLLTPEGDEVLIANGKISQVVNHSHRQKQSHQAGGA